MLQREDAILNKKVNGKKATLGGQGRHESIPLASDMAAFMKDVCDQEHILTHTHLISFMKLHHMEWLEEYLAAKTNDDRAYHSLMRLCQRFSLRYRYSQRVPCVSRLTQAVLMETRDNFAAAFWDKFRDTAAEDIINVDETSVYYDMPPGKTLAPIGGSSKVDTSQKHSDRMTAVGTSSVSIDPPEASVDTVSTELFGILEPLLKNSTSVCQPLDVGVMGPLKSKLRKKWLTEKPVVTAAEKRLAMIQRTIQAWEEMPCDLIRSSFEKALPQVFML
ncbi:hypothetical protein DYB36_013670 [Aphanomyces astaci]|uniref:DDE-1 domain-containing protein n=1 Tax=Aphanomyces astaci TaxID=112090 RepID=A0A397A178_APHAT|nr:hypothetical protein DYB36_013670 [Aphanomyces astaci]